MTAVKRLEQKMNTIEGEVVTIRCYLDEDSKLTPAERKLVDASVRKVKAGDFSGTVTLEELRKKVGA